MELLRSRRDLARLPARGAGQPALVLVPTMGALHAGHLSLVEQARAWGTVVVSIFVNPLQFGPGEDYSHYPRDLDRDLALLQPLDVAAVFAPDAADIFPRQDAVTVSPGPAARFLCGASRPGHFQGVLTVVAKLLHLVQPQVAVFGRKDAQQCLVIAEMVRDLDFPVRLVDLPTVREPDGLAMSSRNAYLSIEERRRAGCLSEALQQARQALARGERLTDRLREILRSRLAAADQVEYAEVCRVPDLQIPHEATGHLLLAAAVRIGRTRLIDNLVVRVSATGIRDVPLLAAGESEP